MGREEGKALGLQQIWRDDKFTYLRGHFQETPALYEMKDGNRALSTSISRWPLHGSQDRCRWLSHHRQTTRRVQPHRSEVAMIDDQKNIPS